MNLTFVGNSANLQFKIEAERIKLNQLQSEIELLIICQKKLAENQKQQIQETIKAELAKKIEQLEVVADRINALSAQLETELIKFKEIAIETNQLYQALQKKSALNLIELETSKMYRLRPSSIWQVHFSSVPTVARKKREFILTEKRIDLFNQDKEGNAARFGEARQNRRKAFLDWLDKNRHF